MSKKVLTLFLFIGISTSLVAQRVSYPQLVNRSQAPTIFIDELILPGEDGRSTLAFIFRFNNDFIPFKKIPANSTMNAPSDAEFYSTIRLNTEIFEGESKRRQQPSVNSVARDTWRDTLFASTYEQTQSKDHYASGALTTQLAPGTYNFLLQLSMMQEISERNTQRRNITIPDLAKETTGEVYLIRNVNMSANLLSLMNMQNNVPFGKDFNALIRIPNYDSSANYTLRVNKANTSQKDTTSGSGVYKYVLTENDIHPNSAIQLLRKQDPALELKKGEHPFTYALVSIPGSTFENSSYFLTLSKDESEKPIAKYLFKSYWPDMPASLYNLNVAIDMLKYILPENEIEQINSGNNQEREKKFREFWKQRDPTPETVYNELKTEYYRRIDYAYQEFGSQQQPLGHETDQGEIYIKFGPPNEKERVFPSDGRTREIWKYPNRTFVFEATSGFGDFELVGSR